MFEQNYQWSHRVFYDTGWMIFLLLDVVHFQRGCESLGDCQRGCEILFFSRKVTSGLFPALTLHFIGRVFQEGACGELKEGLVQVRTIFVASRKLQCLLNKSYLSPSSSFYFL